MIVPLSQPQHIDWKHFWALFHTPTTLRLPPPIFFCGRLEYNISFQKTLPWQLLSSYVFPPALATLLQTPCCNIFMLKYFRRTSTLQKFFNIKIFATKIFQFMVCLISCFCSLSGNQFSNIGAHELIGVLRVNHNLQELE